MNIMFEGWKEIKMIDKKVAVITGATSGIGTAVAERMAKDGYYTILLGRNVEKGNSISESINSEGLSSVFLRCDVTSESSVSGVANTIINNFGRVDMLFNNAGIMLQSKELERLPVEEWRRTFETNIDSVFLIMKCLKSVIFDCKGCIINNASIAGMHSYVAGRSYAYSASKSALIQFTRQMAINYAGEGIRVNCICPGIIDTPILGDRDRSEYAKRIPLGYIGKPEDVANVVAFLASDEASYLTGVVLPVDGGVSLS